MTVRSHVATVYGTIRGDVDQTIIDPVPAVQEQFRREDVESRAIRFQETLDRLPTLMGEPAPIRIGERVVGAYQDVHNN